MTKRSSLSYIACVLIAVLSFCAHANDYADAIITPQTNLSSPKTNGKYSVSCADILSHNPIIILAAGQSLVANMSGDFRWNRVTYDAVYEQWGGACYEASSPMYGASGTRQSFVIYLADYLRRSTGRPILINMAAINGVSISRFLDAEPSRILDAQLHNIETLRVSPTLIIWEQGQSDYSTSATEYDASFGQMLSKLRRAAPNAPVFVPVDTMSSWKISANMQKIQRGLTQFEGVYTGPNIDQIKYRYDGTHLDQKGIEMQAAMWFQFIAQHFGWDKI
ncbi:SGNH/GDSL hydrolase family protein [Gluconobacter oxydans]|uniref:SGNH/GDSL hydrolase family protein n=1 Tax=Gluconobacter oxydans TaxID=442 RepID=UPI000AF990C0|nr:SGNH/GDSL hydrolase family protein [Gluconobacter oxydans]